MTNIRWNRETVPLIILTVLEIWLKCSFPSVKRVITTPHMCFKIYDCSRYTYRQAPPWPRGKSTHFTLLFKEKGKRDGTEMDGNRSNRKVWKTLLALIWHEMGAFGILSFNFKVWGMMIRIKTLMFTYFNTYHGLRSWSLVHLSNYKKRL